MNADERKKLRALVRTMYDYQDMKLRIKSRLRMNKDDQIVDEENMDDAVISEPDYAVMEHARVTNQDSEKKIAKEIEKIIIKERLYTEFLVNVRGCGPLLTAAIMAEFDIYKADTISKMWQFAGLNPGMVRGKKVININKNTDMSCIIREYKNKKGERCGIIKTDEMVRGDRKTAGFVSPFNSWLRTKLCGVLAGSMIKAKNTGDTGRNYALEFYDPYKARLEQEDSEVMHCKKMTSWKDVNKGHRNNAAKRYMIKMFIKDLYVAWRTIEGLPVRVPYAEEYLGKKHSESETEIKEAIKNAKTLVALVSKTHLCDSCTKIIATCKSNPIFACDIDPTLKGKESDRIVGCTGWVEVK